MRLCTAAATFLISSAFAASYSSLRVKHAWDSVPRQWQDVGQPSPDELITLSVGLKQGRIESLIAQLYDISDPDSVSYGQHLTHAEVDALITPDTKTTAAVNDWLASNEIDPTSIIRSDAGDWVDVTVTIAKAEEMLGTTYKRFRHRETATHVVRALSYALPEELHDAVDVVLPTTEFITSETSDTRRMRKMLERRGSLPDTMRPAPSQVPRPPPGQDPTLCNPFTTPECLRELYSTTNYVVNAADKNKFGVVGYLEQYANFVDLQTFFSQFFPRALGSNFTYTTVNGGQNDQNRPRVEANLDIQYSTSQSFPTPNIYYSVGDRPPFIPDASTPNNTNEPYIEWLRYILNQNDIPQTFTTSYAEPEQTVPFAYALRVCNTFAQLGARGSSVLFATGDFGVGNSDPDCRTNDGFNRTRFQPFFPASCPYVTAVGGTTSAAPEVAAALSGGGFSRYFLRPVYQFSSVSDYLGKIGNRYAGLYNRLGRAYPDVSAHATDYLIVVGGWTGAVDGTSASTPTFAAVVALLNDFRLANGKKPLGFLNPLLYGKLAGGLTDIRLGNNPGCGTPGFNATVGWDPVTGLGTPNFPILKTLISQLR